MGVNTDGSIMFGVVCPGDAELPWETDEYDYIDEWWAEVKGYVPKWEPFTKDGEWAEGFDENDPRWDEEYEHKREWLAENPVPVSPENYCSQNVPMYVLAVPGTVLTCRRGYPETIDPSLMVVDSEQVRALMDFLERYEIESDGIPRWLLTSYWG